MTDLGDGIDLEYFNDQPAMLFFGQASGWWYALHWWPHDWVFVVDAKKANVITWALDWKRDTVEFMKHSPGYEGARPKEHQQLVDQVKELIRSGVKEFRESIGPREWSPRWPQSEGAANGGG